MKTLLTAALCLSAAAVHAQAPVQLNLGEPVYGELSYSDARLADDTYYDLYSFVARRGETIEVTLESHAFDTFLYVGERDRGGFREIATNDDADGTNSRVTFVPESDGVFLVRANSLGRATGPYTVTVHGGRGRAGHVPSTGSKPVYGGTPVSRPGYIARGQYVDGVLTGQDPRLDGGEPFHLYRMQGRAGERVVLTLTSSEFDTYLVIGTAGGRHGVQSALARDDDGGGGTNSRIAFTLPYDGEYVIRVNAMVSGTGRYRLTVD